MLEWSLCYLITSSNGAVFFIIEIYTPTMSMSLYRHQSPKHIQVLSVIIKNTDSSGELVANYTMPDVLGGELHSKSLLQTYTICIFSKQKFGSILRQPGGLPFSVYSRSVAYIASSSYSILCCFLLPDPEHTRRLPRRGASPASWS